MVYHQGKKNDNHLGYPPLFIIRGYPQENHAFVVRFSTDISSEGNFFTDDGLEVISRKWDSSNFFTASYFPIINLAYIQDQTNRFVVFTRQSIGGSSLKSGSLEVLRFSFYCVCWFQNNSIPFSFSLFLFLSFSFSLSLFLFFFFFYFLSFSFYKIKNSLWFTDDHWETMVKDSMTLSTIQDGTTFS